MAEAENKATGRLNVGAATLNAQNVQLREDIILDEVRIEGADISLEPSAASGQPARVKTGEIKFRAAMSETNLNRMLAANPQPESPIRNLRVALFSGKARISGNFVKVISLPFSVDATVKITNGVRLHFDLTSARLIIGFPAAAVEALEQYVNRAAAQDLTKLPIPVYLDEVRCEPGRLTVSGKARINWPPIPGGQVLPPFSVRETELLSSAPEPLALPPTDAS